MHLHIFMKCTLLFPLIFSPLKYIFWKTIYDQLVNHISVMSGAFTNETRHCAVCLPPGSAAQVCENTLNETIIALQRFCVHCMYIAWLTQQSVTKQQLEGLVLGECQLGARHGRLQGASDPILEPRHSSGPWGWQEEKAREWCWQWRGISLVIHNKLWWFRWPSWCLFSNWLISTLLSTRTVAITPPRLVEQGRRGCWLTRMEWSASLRGLVSLNLELELLMIHELILRKCFSYRCTLRTSCATPSLPGTPTRESTLSPGPMEVGRAACSRLSMGSDFLNSQFCPYHFQ